MSRERPERRVTYRRFYNHQYAALIVAGVFIALRTWRDGPLGFVTAVALMMFILPNILFPEAMASIIGPGYTTARSHPGCLALTAWMLLIVVLARVLWM